MIYRLYSKLSLGLQCKELNNGRLAMMGITGLIAQDVLYGDFGEAAVLPCFGAAVCKDFYALKAFMP